LGRDRVEERDHWRTLVRERPDGIEPVGPGEESVWDYPRPPVVEPVPERVTVEFGAAMIADSRRAYRVLETASPPTYYIPLADVRTEFLVRHAATTFCEWKGVTIYWSIRVGKRMSERAAWSYPRPEPGFEMIRDHLAFFAGRVDECRLGGEIAIPQPGQYYGGWITSKIRGPFKGGPGTGDW
jgi:uncharacterized protein (DUF427 family)